MRLLFMTARRRPDDHRGVTSIEYALLAALIAIAIVVSVMNLSEGVEDLFSRVVDAVGG